MYQVVQRHLETWLVNARASDPDAKLIPGYPVWSIRYCGFFSTRWRRRPVLQSGCPGRRALWGRDLRPSLRVGAEREPAFPLLCHRRAVQRRRRGATVSSGLPDRHRHRYHGVLAPNAPLRGAVTACAGLPMDTSLGQASAPKVPPQTVATDTQPTFRAAHLWAVLLARIYEVLSWICPECGNPMRLIAFVTESEPVKRILTHVGEPNTPPPISPARSPPLRDHFDWDQFPAFDPEWGEPAPEFQFDQTIRW